MLKGNFQTKKELTGIRLQWNMDPGAQHFRISLCTLLAECITWWTMTSPFTKNVYWFDCPYVVHSTPVALPVLYLYVRNINCVRTHIRRLSVPVVVVCPYMLTFFIGSIVVRENGRCSRQPNCYCMQLTNVRTLDEFVSFRSANSFIYVHYIDQLD